MNQEKIGKFISMKRGEKNLTQQVLADKLGVTDRAVSKWERGLGICDPSLMLSLCQILGISVNDLLSGESTSLNQENEIKVLDVDVSFLRKKLESLGATLVYDDNRNIMALDTSDRLFLDKKDILLRITDEGKIKVTMHINQSNPELKREIRFKTDSLNNVLSFFHELGVDPITQVNAHRISYKLGKIDFDIDIFDKIPAFLEIGVEMLSSYGYTIESLLKELGLDNHKIVKIGTEDVHKLYGIDYFEEYKIK